MASWVAMMTASAKRARSAAARQSSKTLSAGMPWLLYKALAVKGARFGHTDDTGPDPDERPRTRRTPNRDLPLR